MAISDCDCVRQNVLVWLECDGICKDVLGCDGDDLVQGPTCWLEAPSSWSSLSLWQPTDSSGFTELSATQPTFLVSQIII